MKGFLKAVGIVVAVALVLAGIAVWWAYATFCGGHPHGLC